VDIVLDANQAMRLGIGDTFNRHGYRVRMEVTEDEARVLSALPEHVLEGADLLAFIDQCETVTSLMMMAGRSGMDRAFLARIYEKLARRLAQFPGADPRLPAMCLVRSHVLEHLLRAGDSEAQLAEVLGNFNAMAAHCTIVRHSAANTQTGSAGVLSPGLFHDNELDRQNTEIERLILSGDSEGAARLAANAAAAAEQRYGQAHPVTLSLLGRAAFATGQLRVAEQALRAAAKTSLVALDEKIHRTPVLIVTLLATQALLAEMYLNLGRTQEAIDFAQAAFGHYLDFTSGLTLTGQEAEIRAFRSYQISVEIDALEVGAKVYLALGHPNIADLLTRAACRRAVNLFGHSKRTAQLHLLFALVYTVMGFAREAEEHFQAAEERIAIPAAYSLDRAALLMRMNELDRAQALLNALEKPGGLTNELLPFLASLYGDLASKRGDVDGTLQWKAQAVEFSDRVIEAMSARMSDRELQARIQTESFHAYELLDCAAPFATRKPWALVAAFEAVVRRRYLATDVQRHIHAARGVEPELRGRLAAMRSKVAAARLIDHAALSVDAPLNDALAETERLEAMLAAAVGPFHFPAANARQMADALPEGAALVEYVEIPACRQRGDTAPRPRRYGAFVIDHEALGFIEFEDPGVIDTAVEQFLDEVTAGSPQVDRYGERVRELIFDPMATILDSVTHLFIAPAGAISRVPFAALPFQGGCLLDRWPITYVACARDLLARRGAAPFAPPVVFADPDYDLGLPPGTERTWERLEGARREGEEIGALLKVAPLGDANASEARFKALASPCVLHIATHGYFQDRSLDVLARRELNGTQVRALSLRGGGLVFAGANAFIANCVRALQDQDGIVNTADVLELDLSGTRLAVLSACETARGAADVAEGLLGLRRSFAIAGVRTLIMSLWKVPDTTTRLLMRHFYERVLSGAPCGEALACAQKRVKKDSPHVMSWGAFICQGDPGPLDAAVLEAITQSPKTGT
jgi:CHAT domain-containing protein/tetratricopeptide (TPR) repeat protein